MRSVIALICAFLLLAILGPMFAPHDPSTINIAARLSPPNADWLLGTDALGRDILSRLLHGARWSLGLAFMISLIGLFIGTAVGLVAALGGKAADWLVMRVTDSFLAFPELVAAVVIAGILGGGVNSLILALSLTGWMRYARVSRGIGLSLGTNGYVVQARLAGLSPFAIARWHYLPSLLPSLTVVWTGMFARAILGISALGFLGFGVQPPNPEWGSMLLDARVHLRSTPLQMIWPGLAVVICVLEFPGGLATKRPGAHFLRAGFGALALFGSFAAVARLSLAEAILISQLSPILMAVGATFLLSERLTKWRVWGLVLGFCGVIVLVWPDLTTTTPDAGRLWGYAIGLAAAVLSALALIMVRNLSRTESPGAIALYFVLASMIGGLASLPWGWVTPELPMLGLLILSGLFGGFGHIAMTLAFKYAEASRLAPFEYVALLWPLLADLFIFQLELSTAFILAGPLILMGAVIAAAEKTRPAGPKRNS